MQQFIETVTANAPSTTIGRTLADCQAVAAMYDNTCDGTGPIDLDTHEGAEMSCTG